VTGATGTFATGATLFYTNYGTGASGVNVPIPMGDTVYSGTDPPNNVVINVATGATGAVVTISATGATGASLSVGPGTGATGTIAPFNALASNVSFAATGTTQYTSPTGLTGITGASGLSILVSTGPSGPVVTFDYSQLAKDIRDLKVSQN
jgi:hypothetical protein